MPRLHSILALCAIVFLTPVGLWAKPKASASAATVVLLDGTVTGKDQVRTRALELGQHLSALSSLSTAAGSSAHLVLANGSSLVLGPNSELALKMTKRVANEPHFDLSLKRGTLYLMADPLYKLAAFDLSTPEASLQVEAAYFELSTQSGETRVSVGKGQLKFGDSAGKRFETVGALQGSRIFSGRIERATTLSKRDSGDLRARWQRSEMVHQQRLELLKHFR